jgi:hypothetical protein
LDNLEKLASLLKEQAIQAKQKNRVIDIEKANQLYMKYFTTNGKLIKQNHVIEPTKKKIEIELSKNLDAKLVKTDQNTKIVITTTSINSDEKTEEIEKVTYFSSPSDDDEDDSDSPPLKVQVIQNDKKSLTEMPKKDKTSKLADINKIEITNDNFNQMNANNNKEIEQVFNNYINKNIKSDSDEKNNKSKIKRNGHIFDDNVNYSEIQSNKQEEKPPQTPVGTISQKASSNLISLADKRKTPVTMLRKIATPPPLPHILDKLRYLNVNELINKRSSKCSEKIVSPCSQAKSSQATISSDLHNTSKSSSDESSIKQIIESTENRQICSNGKNINLRRRKSCHTPAPIINLNQEITIDTNNNNQKKQINENNNKNHNMACETKKTELVPNSHLVIKVKEDVPVEQTLNNGNNNNKIPNLVDEVESTNAENTSKAIDVPTPKTPIPLTALPKETLEKQNCKKSLNKQLHPLVDNSHYSIRNKYEG